MTEILTFFFFFHSLKVVFLSTLKFESGSKPFNSILKTLSSFNIPFALPLKDKTRRYSIGDERNLI